MESKDRLGDRMKAWENLETERRFKRRLPTYARIDGRGFSKFTAGMDRPFDPIMSMAMMEVTRYLVDKTKADIGYTQSDEISLVWAPGSESLFFAGKAQKMVSVIASMAAAKFARVCPAGYEDRLPHFDCRVFQLPSREEAANAIVWRALDARKNAISMLAQAHFSHKALQNVKTKGMLEMLAEIGIDFETMPEFFKDGTYYRRVTREVLLTPQELVSIPEKFRPTGPVLRSSVQGVSCPKIWEVKNKVEFVFDQLEPIYWSLTELDERSRLKSES